MADDAGAVRRTPRPAPVPELWWSPAECAVYADREGCAPRYVQMRDTARGPLPPDAVQLVGPDQRRPIVEMRAEDCDCQPPYADCSHGPEPVDALDLAVWLHAEAKWWLDQYMHDVTLWKRQVDELTAEVGKLRADAVKVKRLDDEAYARHRDALYAVLGCTGPEGSLIALIKENVAAVVAERDALQARLDAALAELAKYEPTPGCCTACNGNGTVPTGYPCEDCYATGHSHPETVACTGGPTEPEIRCMNGPAKQHTLRMVEVIKALKSAAGMDQLPLEPPSRDNFVRLARAIADYWPREIDRPPAEPAGEVDRG